MTAHSSGSGSSWNETLDVDQPHGLDYREWNDIRIGIRKRESQEHATYADSTVGGIHKPGGAAILGIDDDTATVVADGTYRGHGLVWDGSVNLWCWTKTAGATDAPGVAGTEDFTILKMHPDKQWGGQDVTWAGAHEFDASVDITGNTAIDGDLSVDSTVVCGGDLVIEGDLSLTGDLSVGGGGAFVSDLTITGDLVVDGTAVFTSEVDVSGNCDISGTLNLFKHAADTTGYCYLPGDIIMQWGGKSVAIDGTADFTYAISFPNAVWKVTLTGLVDNKNTSAEDRYIMTQDVDGIGVMNAANQATVMQYIAIGN